jgi:VanZ family protein
MSTLYLTQRGPQTRLTATTLPTKSILAVICLFVLVGILTAGLWPFHSPENQVAWLRSGNGLQLRRHGTLLSAGYFGAAGTPDATGNSVEIWLQPAVAEGSSTILAFYNADARHQFSLHQSDDFLGLQADLYSATASDPSRVAYVPGVFRDRVPRFITVTSGSNCTAVYIDGALAKVFPRFRPGGTAFTGRLVLANSPVKNDSWSGRLLGFAIYDQELTAAEVLRHYKSWTGNQRPDIRHSEQSVAVYLFDEHSGALVHNQAYRNAVDPGIDLLIPEQYAVLDEKFLEPAWKEFQPTWSYWKSVLINVLGFIPLGFFFYAYLVARRTSRPALTTIILGAAVSLTIEVFQTFLPTRDSGTTDLITNTFGTCLGVLLYRWKPTLLRHALQRFSFLARLA